jgi:hypothetical protein
MYPLTPGESPASAYIKRRTTSVCDKRKFNWFSHLEEVLLGLISP